MVLSMAKDQVFVDTKQLNRLTIELKGFEKQIPGAVFSALNRTLDHAITQVGRIVPKAYAVKSKDVKNSFSGGIKRPTKTDLTASITSKGHTLSLANFPHSPKQPATSGKKYKVKATIKKGNGNQTINTNPKPFVASTGAKSDDKVQYNIFRRIGSKRLPIKIIRTLSIPQMIGNEGVGEQIQKIANEKLEERITHEVNYRLDKMKNDIKKG
ncbi:MAG: hypothetical protein K0R80_1609 [Clostridia bacterium]|jgi:hypothetical protein|nr:hypothetical protein [Clostridia bacterium]